MNIFTKEQILQARGDLYPFHQYDNEPFEIFYAVYLWKNGKRDWKLIEDEFKTEKEAMEQMCAEKKVTNKEDTLYVVRVTGTDKVRATKEVCSCKGEWKEYTTYYVPSKRNKFRKVYK